MAPFKVLWLTLKDLFDELFLLMGMNVVWVLINLPLGGLAVFLVANGDVVLGGLVGLLALVPMAPATAGLYAVAERVADGRAISFRDFFTGIRQHAVLSWRVFLPWGIGLAVILVNIRFYATMGNAIGAFLQFFFLYILLIWFGLLVYLGPLMLLQHDKRLRIIARNALLMTLGRPIFSLITVVLMAVISVATAWVPILPAVVTFALLALWSFRATARLIKDAEERREAALLAAQSNSRQSTEKGRAGQVRPHD